MSARVSGGGWLEASAGWDLAVLQVAPQGDGQTPCQSHYADAAHALARTCKAPVEPLRQCAARLQAQPAPGKLDQQGAHSSIAGLADALLDLAVTAGVGSRHQAEAARQLTSVGEVPPAEHLLDEHPGTLGPDGAQADQLRDQRLLALGKLPRALGFDRSDLL